MNSGIFFSGMSQIFLVMRFFSDLVFGWLLNDGFYSWIKQPKLWHFWNASYNGISAEWPKEAKLLVERWGLSYKSWNSFVLLVVVVCVCLVPLLPPATLGTVSSMIYRFNFENLLFGVSISGPVKSGRLCLSVLSSASLLCCFYPAPKLAYLNLGFHVANIHR